MLARYLEVGPGCNRTTGVFLKLLLDIGTLFLILSMEPMALENVAQCKKVAGFAFSHTFHEANVIGERSPM